MAILHRMRRVFAASLGFALLAAGAARAGDGDVDNGFGVNGRAIHSWPLTTIQSETNALGVGADGSVVVAGWISYPAPTQRDAISLVRFRADGTHDAAFGADGVALFDLDPASQIGEAALGAFALADGRVLVAARRTIANSHQPLLLAVRADGSADTTFGSNGVREIDTTRWTGKRLQFFAALYHITADANAALDEVGLGKARDLPCQYLSAGQKKRLSLARLKLSNRPLWLLDEPLAALDTAGKSLAAQFISSHVASGGIAIVATHEALGIDAARLALA